MNRIPIFVDHASQIGVFNMIDNFAISRPNGSNSKLNFKFNAIYCEFKNSLQ